MNPLNIAPKLNTHPHLEESLQRDIDRIRTKVAEMAGLTEQALKASVQALTERSRPFAYSVILRDQFIDELETELNQLCLEFLARHQPVAGHLRFVFAAIQINRELERIGDYAESVARQVLAVSALEPPPPFDRFVELGRLSVTMVHDAAKSFLDGDAKLAERTMEVEEQANTLRDAINAQIADLKEAGQIPPAAVTPLVNVARRLERATDQAKNLCEEVLYMCTGEFIKHKGAEGFRILFLDWDTACLSRLAQAIAQGLQVPRFAFSFAGIQAEAPDPRLLPFLASKGITLPQPVGPALTQVPGWDHYQVIVALGAAARDAVPPHAGKTICFTWTVANPAESPGSLEAARPAFEAAYQTLESNIRDLVSAILQVPHLEQKL